MAVTECNNCGGELCWQWSEAFEKFGFMDGDGQVETWQVQAVLSEAGYECTVQDWGMHNTVIASIKKDGTELIPYDNPNCRFGYDDPRGYLPSEITALLDDQFPD